MQNLKKISVCIIVKNAQKTIFECLNMLKDFDEIILLDNQSDDDTKKIANKFTNVKIFESGFIGFGALKNLAISYAKNDWILSIDSDEILEKQALDFINTLELIPQNIYAINRKNYYNHQWIKACGWYPDFVWRLFNKKHTKFNSNLVHESLLIPPSTKKIKLPIHLKHYTAANISQLIQKLDSYTNLALQEKKDRHSSITKAILRFIWVFFKDYFLRFGWRYGYRGFIIAWLNAMGSFIKYAKIYEKQQNKP